MAARAGAGGWPGNAAPAGGNSVPVELTVNGQAVRPEIRPSETLLDVLRNRLRLTGAKDGCGRGECGSCTVLVGGRPIMSCVTFAACVDEPIETIEGLADESRSLREAFADRGAFQCAYCTPGMVVRGVALLRDGLPERDADIRRALAGNICRCTGYQGIVEALRSAAACGSGQRP